MGTILMSASWQSMTPYMGKYLAAGMGHHILHLLTTLSATMTTPDSYYALRRRQAVGVGGRGGMPSSMAGALKLRKTLYTETHVSCIQPIDPKAWKVDLIIRGVLPRMDSKSKRKGYMMVCRPALKVP